jgi:thymidylate synthase (FAD)
MDQTGITLVGDCKMNIIQPYAKLVGPVLPTDPFTREDGVRLLRRIEYFGRFSHASEEAQTDTSWERFIQAVVIGHGDWSIVEHASVTVDTVVDRGVTHEWVRHRLFSFTQSSTRFINYAKKMPPSFIYPDPDNWEGYIDDPAWCESIVKSEETYRKKLADGWPPQKARSVFPNALSSRIATTGNLRNWRHVMIMRTTKETHPQFKQVSIPLLAEMQSKIPIIFDDIIPNDKQSEAIKKAR